MRRSVSGEHHGKRRSTALSIHIGPNPDGPAVLLDQLLADTQPKAGSDRALGREERVEDMLRRSQYHAVPVVRHSDPDAGSPIGWINRGRSTQNNPAILTNRIQAICKQVCHHLPQLPCDSHYPKQVIALLLDPGSVSSNLRLKQID